MKIKSTLFILNFIFVCSAFSSDIMVERMQSVVDEVSELRLRYESSVRKNKECLNQVQEQNKVIKKISMDEGLDYKVFEENRKRLISLETENKRLKDSIGKNDDTEVIVKKLSDLEQENKRLNISAQILLEKNNSLLAQVNKLKRTQDNDSKDKFIALETQIVSLEKQIEHDKKSGLVKDKPLQTKKYSDLNNENKRLAKELKVAMAKECKPKKRAKSKVICLDDNPFPKLMMKDKKDIKPFIKKEKSTFPHKLEEEPVIDLTPSFEENNTTGSKLNKAGTYRVKYESSIYDAPDGNIVEIWERKTSFTGSLSEGEWIKVTGYFVDQKWQKNTEEKWVKEEQTLRR